MTDLLDINVWLALADENHVHHESALNYWQNLSQAEMAFCRVTALGFLRLSTHPQVLSRPLTPDEGWDIYRRYRAEAHVSFIEDSEEIDRGFMALTRRPEFLHHLWTDCYLAALAQLRGCRVVSFDADFKHFAELKFLQLG